MQTRELSTRSRDIKTAADLLQNHGLVVFPTETVYGLGADADSREAVEKIFAAKNRPKDNPLIVHVSDIGMASEYSAGLSSLEAELLSSFAPGPFTLIVKRAPRRGEAAAAGQSTLGLRIPDSPAALELIRETGRGIAAPSANRSGRPSPTNFSMAWSEMSGRVDAVIHGPPCIRGLESTIVRCTPAGVEILRPGSITAPMLESALRRGGHDLPVLQGGGLDSPATPGTRYRHYAPTARVVLFQSPEELMEALKNGGRKSVSSDTQPRRQPERQSERQPERQSGRRMFILPDAGFMGKGEPALTGDGPFSVEPAQTGDDPFSVEPAQTGDDPFSVEPAHTGDDPFSVEPAQTGNERAFLRVQEIFQAEERKSASAPPELRIFGNAEEYARNLYQTFVDADRLGCEALFAYFPLERPETVALRDRLLRAARG